MTAAVELYTKFTCSFCGRAKQLLSSKGVDYVEYDITMGGPKRDEMVKRAPGACTVPQIFINGSPIGGYDELSALERAGKLDNLLAGNANS